MALFGGFCNNLMNSRLPPSIVTLMEKEIDYIPILTVEELVRSISPIFLNKESTVYENLVKAILYEHQKKTNSLRQNKLQEVNTEIVSKARLLNQNLALGLNKILTSPQFKDAIKTALEKKEQIIIDPYNRVLNKSIESRSDPFGTLSKMKTNPNLEVFKPASQKYQLSHFSKVADNKTTETCKNLLSQPQCICLNERPIFEKDQNSFECIHCQRFFHTSCMKKKSNSSCCIYCHIERMIPLKKVKKIVYVGLFRRNVRRHMTQIFIPALEPNQKIQIRCLRLKQGAPTACLFPDIATITINGHHIKDFEPINKASCLKYRKDEPFNLMKGDYYPNQDNTLILSETCSTFKEKDIRYQSENHLFGMFITEDIKINQLIEEIKEENLMGYSQSSSILKESFASFGKEDQDLTCQLVKIPLTCPLSTLRIDIPVRGIFCNHFQCFDLKNYLTLISDSGNPRWNCPLCKSFAYELQIDPILLEILKSIKQNDKIQEILFFKNGDYTAIIDDQPDPCRKNIRSLNIPEKKRKLVQRQVLAEEKPVKKIFQIPVNAEVIDLDD